MMFTVLMAIWGLTSRSYRSSLKLVNTNNALPIGLAFGYAYAGSVAMLTTVLNDIKTVMMAGHLVVALTFLWIQPRVLASTMGGVKASERIQKVVDKAVLAAEEDPAVDEVVASEQPEDGPAGGVGQVVAVAETDPKSIGEGISWSKPEVLASDVSWDDDEIELLD